MLALPDAVMRDKQSAALIDVFMAAGGGADRGRVVVQVRHLDWPKLPVGRVRR